MQILRLHEGDRLELSSVVTMGNFDGVHMGHRILLEKLVCRAQQKHLVSVVVTFEPHTREVVTGEEVPRLSTAREKELLLEEYGVDYLVEISFSPHYMAMGKEQFQQQVLIGQLSMKEFVSGEDHRFGNKKAESAKSTASKVENAILSTAIKLYGENGVVAGSREIRDHLAKGEVEAAVTMLGHPYLIVAKRVRGKQIGSENGYPTLNFKSNPQSSKIIPPAGVYAAEVQYQGQKLKGCLYYGDCPTYGDRDLHFEFYSLDLITVDPDVDEECLLWLHKHVRLDRAFSSTQALVTQITKDVETIKRYFVAGSN